MTKLVDVRDLKSPGEIHPGSTPGEGTRIDSSIRFEIFEERPNCNIVKNIIHVYRISPTHYRIVVAP